MLKFEPKESDCRSQALNTRLKPKRCHETSEKGAHQLLNNPLAQVPCLLLGLWGSYHMFQALRQVSPEARLPCRQSYFSLSLHFQPQLSQMPVQLSLLSEAFLGHCQCSLSTSLPILHWTLLMTALNYLSPVTAPCSLASFPTGWRALGEQN